MNKSADAYIGFLHYEKGLASNTCVAYQRDIQKLSRLVAGLSIEQWSALTVEHLRCCLVTLNREGLSPRSLHRWLSVVRQFLIS